MHLKRNWCFSSYYKVHCQCAIFVLGELSAAIWYVFAEIGCVGSLAFDVTLWAYNIYRSVYFLPMSRSPPSCNVLQAGDLILEQSLEVTAWARQTHWLPRSQSSWQPHMPLHYMGNRLLCKSSTGRGNILICRSWPSAFYTKHEKISCNADSHHNNF